MQQSAIELLIHPKHIAKDIIKEIQESFPDELTECVIRLNEYIAQDYWESKNKRMQYLSTLELEYLLAKVLTKVVMIADKSLPLINVCNSMSFPNFTKTENIQTVAELLYILSEYNWFSISTNVEGTRYIQSNIELSNDLERRLQISCVLPPMIVRPKRLTRNNSSGFLTIKKDSLILGFKENYHDKCLSLDVLNTLNSTRYELDKEIVYKFEQQFDLLDKKSFDKLDDEQKEIYQNQKTTYLNKKEQFEFFRDKLNNSDIYFTHKVDKRGRIYSQGYHFTTQGSSYEKACINLKTKEYVIGEL